MGQFCCWGGGEISLLAIDFIYDHETFNAFNDHFTWDENETFNSSFSIDFQ